MANSKSLASRPSQAARDKVLDKEVEVYIHHDAERKAPYKPLKHKPVFAAWTSAAFQIAGFVSEVTDSGIVKNVKAGNGKLLAKLIGDTAPGYWRGKNRISKDNVLLVAGKNELQDRFTNPKNGNRTTVELHRQMVNAMTNGGVVKYGEVEYKFDRAINIKV